MRKKAEKVTGGGLLDLRKITLGHRLSLTVMLPGGYVVEGAEDLRFEAVRKHGTDVHLLNASLSPFASIRDKLLEGAGKLSRHLHGIESTRGLAGVGETHSSAR